ncbi:MAG TPA: DedA family protein [Aliarcobacter sp.]|nr:DedA family protein [Aliarcobacter sp.]
MEQFIQDWGYIALFLYSFGGGFLALAIAGAFSFDGTLNIYITVMVAAVANIVGSQFLFFMAKNNKNYAQNMMNNHKRKVALVQLLFRKYGFFVIIIQKYIYGIKTLVPLVMGLSDYSAFKFTLINSIASILWAFVIGYASYIAGSFLLEYADNFKYVGLFTVIIVLTILIISFRPKKKRKSNKNDI